MKKEPCGSFFLAKPVLCQPDIKRKHMNTRIKICCIADTCEARMAMDAGAWALGLVSHMPSGVGPISDELIASVSHWVGGEVETFLLTCRQDAASIIEQVKYCRPSTVQLVDSVSVSDLQKIKAALPDVAIVQVIHVISERSVDEAIEVTPWVDMLLLDSGNPELAVKVLGGTGQTHNWDYSAEIVRRSRIPVFLAGGLNPDNVADAIRQVRPYGVDLCSRIRTDGALDADKLTRFVAAVRSTANV
jgi:phosphoribosylanthranilate isomerase